VIPEIPNDRSPIPPEYRGKAIVHQPALLKWAYRRTGNREVAADLVQDTYLAFYETGPQPCNPECIRRWLFGVLRNKCNGYWRDEYSHTNETQKRFHQDDLDYIEDRAASVAESVTQHLDRVAAQQHHEHLLRGSPLLEIYRLRLEGHSPAEIAELLSVPVSTVGSCIYRAKKKIIDDAMDRTTRRIEEFREQATERKADRLLDDAFDVQANCLQAAAMMVVNASLFYELRLLCQTEERVRAMSIPRTLRRISPTQLDRFLLVSQAEYRFTRQVSPWKECTVWDGISLPIYRSYVSPDPRDHLCLIDFLDNFLQSGEGILRSGGNQLFVAHYFITQAGCGQILGDPTAGRFLKEATGTLKLKGYTEACKCLESVLAHGMEGIHELLPESWRFLQQFHRSVVE
jgi:RNA polymerase sigma factor (sigma-70 family)